MADQSRERHDLRAQLDRLGYGTGKAEPRVVPVSDIRRAVRKQRKRESPSAPLPQSVHYGRALPRTQTPRCRTPGQQLHVILEEALSGEEASHADRGPFYLLTTEVATVEAGDSLNQRFPGLLENLESGLCERLARTIEPSGVSVRDLVFMDIETTGLSSSPLFLIGIMVWEEGGFRVHQYFARNYAEEAAVIATSRRIKRGRSWN